MRIVLDYRPALRDRSGVGEYCHRLARALADTPESGPADNGLPRLTLFSSSWKDRFDARTVHPRVGTVDRRIPVSVLNFLWHRTGWPPVELLAGRTFDVAHSPHPLLLPSRSAAQVVTIHDLDFLEHPERTGAEIRRDYAALARAHALRADGVIVPSRYTAGKVQRVLGIDQERVTVCPHGAPPWPLRGDERRTGYILFMGTLEPRKNIPGLLKAYARLLQMVETAPPLWLAGRGTDASARWLENVARPPFSGRIRHLGYVDPDARPALYGGASMLVLPSFDEGFGLPVLEAMTVGVPVVAANCGALPEVAADAAILIDPHDREALAAAMHTILTRPNRAAELSHKGRLRSAEFTWQRSASLALQAYQRAVDRRRARTRS